MIFDKLKVMISEQLDVEEDDITMDTSFQDDLNADSLDLVELIMSIEDEFELEVEDEEVENIQTVRDAVEYIQAQTDLD
ncbi:acyl carrier protein [Anaerosalibacter bizertensis]|uniref:Acyl carrier protein n=1 Tax=Anaerosalibacter bizertensis TaxID=932217 RepID=A0A844FIM6_9FIRM|nr:acyl carrier protein [Anaerosalibacter bizertensis]MBV1816582.1 acyl carrier protein [Bacteroidales bacterium MSK.15.36]HHV27204.1 acyl carrier protein [Tissierellia bacterium]MBU5293328.1 acyl carrier protein [Anaerosalibacter bizertensis]MCB5558614.1 acyl carrier protein [Anaerosalibacter bizertensis]MCG4563969.1 acyl carrier protein [Anaerosalibacter bizertensis]